MDVLLSKHEIRECGGSESEPGDGGEEHWGAKS